MAQLGRIVGDYQLLNELGRGGMGAVYKANDYRRDRIVAMKVLPAELAYTRTFMQRFEREIETLQRLRHPNIVQMYDTGEAEDLRFYCMEYVDGGSIEQLLEGKERLPLAEAVDITYQVAEALEYAHAQGVIHRDIKPANLLIDSKGTVKLTDFGVAKVIEATQATVTSGVVGTIEYLAPEQATGGGVTPATDIYSLGATFYEMVTGRAPFEGETPSQILHKQLHSLPEPPRNLRPDVPRRLNDLIIQMLEKQPERRISSAQALKRELERIKVQLALAGRQLSTEALRQERGWQGYVSLALGLTLLLLVVVGGVLYHSFGGSESAPPAETPVAAGPRMSEARNEMRRAKMKYQDGELELALERCQIILKYYPEFPDYTSQARALVTAIRRKLADGGQAPRETGQTTPTVEDSATPRGP